MTGITHKQAGRYMRKDLDGLLTDIQRRDLQTHLDECAACRRESESFSSLTAQLKTEFQARWDTQHGPSTNVMANVQSQTRRIIMKKRIDFAFNILGGVGTLLVLFFVVTSIISQFQKKSTPATNETQIVADPLSQSNDRLLAFTSEKDGNAEIYTVRADGSGLTDITKDPANDSYPFWSPDGKQITFESDRDGSVHIYLMDADGSNIIQLTQGEGDYHLDANGYSPWSPDGSKLIISHALPGEETFNLYVMDIADTSTIALTDGPGEYILSSWSSDGTHIAFTSAVRGQFSADLYVIASDGSHLAKLTETLPAGEYFSQNYNWSPNGNSIFIATHRNERGYQDPTFIVAIYEVNVNGSVINTLMKSTDAQTIDWWNGVDVRLDSAKQTLSWTRPDGSRSPLKMCPNGGQTSGIVFKRSQAGNLVFGSNCFPNGWILYWSNPDGTAVKPLMDLKIPSYRDSVFHLTGSPDDQYIAFVSVDSTSSDLTETLYVLDVVKAREDPTVQPLEFENSYGQDWQPVSSDETVKEKPTPEPTQPKGLIAYVVAQTKTIGNGEIYTMHADGSGVTNLTNNPATDEYPAWSPDGKQIAFTSDRNGDTDIYVMNADGNNLKRLTDDSGFEGFFSWSPDGQRIVYTSSENSINNAGQLIVMNADGSNKIVLTSELGSYIFLGWSPNSQKIVYQKQNLETNNPQDNEIHVVDIEGTNHYQWSAIIDEIKWTDDQHFIGHGWSGISEPPSWKISKFDANGNDPIELATYPSRVVRLFNQTYVVEDIRTLAWYSSDRAKTPLNTWDYSTQCKKGGDRFLQETGHTISPDETRAFVAVHCSEDVTWFYLESADGSQFVQLTNFSITGPNLSDINWSPNGKYVTAIIGNNTGAEDLYLFDIEKMLKDPSVKPIQITADGAMKYSAVWQPIVKNDIVEENPTPQPTQTSNDLVAFMAETNLATNNNTDIYTMHMDGSAVTNLTHDPTKDFNANDYNPAWSPDKKKIAFISNRGGNSTGNTDIFVMNPDGSDQTRLTNNLGLDDFLAWSPDGKHIAYYSSPVDEFYTTGQLIIMNSDGSNKTVITQEPGYYYFQGWSPDGQKIVYGKPRLVGESFKDIGIHLVNIDGKNQHEWFVGNFDQLHWEDSEHFLGVVQTGTDAQPQWTLYRFTTDGSQTEIATYNAPIAAFFESAYVVDGQSGSMWFTYSNDPISAVPWNSAQKCQATGDAFIATSHVITPNKNQAFVMINCEKSNWFYLENEDGSKIESLNGSIDASLGLLPQWSLDGKSVSIITFNNKDPFADTTVYLFDIEKMLKDPSTQPIQTTLNMTVSGQLVFGFPPGDNDKPQERSTPKPLTFSLTAQQAKLLANFTVLEPSYIPTGYVLEGMDYDPYTQKVVMKYISSQHEGSLLVYQRRGDFVHDPAVQVYITPVSIGDMEAEYMQGAWIYDTPETTTPRWDPSATFYSLTWQKGEVVFSIEFIGGETITPPSLADFVAIAESLK